VIDMGGRSGVADGAFTAVAFSESLDLLNGQPVSAFQVGGSLAESLV
jgi:hypothetical protein